MNKLAQSVSRMHNEMLSMSDAEFTIFHSLNKIHGCLSTGETYASVWVDAAWKEQASLADMLTLYTNDNDIVQAAVNKAAEMCSGYEHGSLRYCRDCGEELPAEFVPVMDNEAAYYQFGSCPFCDSAEGRDLDIEEF